jgi:preprotein translocase subunit SecG
MQVEQIIIVFHVSIALAIIAMILLQQGKGSEMGASFGSGSSQTMFGGAGGGNVLTKATAILAFLFFTTSFALAVVAKNHAGSAGSLDLGVPAVVESDVVELGVPVPAGDEVGELDGLDAVEGGDDSELPSID